MDLNLSPVTLVVKAPNQKIDDQVVECGLGWTIQKLKRHLSTVYPNKPLENQQKLIYSGRLLTDSLLLKDVLRQYEDDQTTHTMHLVCAGEGQPTSYSYSSSSKTSSTVTTVASSSNDGLRHRTPATPASAPVQETSTPQAVPMPQQYTNMQHMYQGMDPMQMMYGGYYPGGQMMMTAEQMQWMQQVYTQQMQQYMQYQQHYYQQAGYPAYAGAYPQASPVAPTPAGVAGQPAAQPAAANEDPQPVRMNAQGGAMADDEEPGRARDWLDGLYTMARFAVIISIVYFNSSLSRFLVVLGVSVLFYAYQHVWPRIRRQRLERELQQQQEEEQRRAAAAEAEAAEAEAAEPNLQSADDTQNDENDGANSEDASAETTEPPPPPPPSTLRVTWSFVSSFFSSLIPAQPPAINAN